MYGLASFRERRGMEGGETNADSEVLEESVANTGAPLFLGDGVRLFDQFGAKQPELEGIGVSGSPAVTHLKCRVVK